MNMTALALHKKQLMGLIVLAAILLGISSFLSIPQAQDPGFPIRTAQVITPFPGASPEHVEELVTDKLEKAIQEMPELESVNSISKYGVSIITVDIQDRYKDLRPIWDSLRRKVDGVQNELPAAAGQSSVNDEYGDVFGIVLSVVANDHSYDELKTIADQVRDEFLRLPLVGKVDIYGAQQERIYIEYENTHLQDLGLSPNYLAQFLANKNVILSGGEWQTEHEVMSIEPSGNLESVEALQRTYVPLPNSTEVLPLGNIANIYRGYEYPPQSMVTTNGDNSLTLAIAMIDGGNIVKLGEQVENLMAQLNQNYPWGVDFEIIAYQPERVENTVDSFVNNLLQAIAVVSGVMLITLGLRTGLIVASLIPVTIAATIAIMYWLGIGLDQVSLAALMIALGMLVDNSIVMAESIMTRMQRGQKAYSAAIESANELKLSLLTSSLTTSAAFLPIFLAESTTGEYTAPLFKVVSITLLASWFFSLTMIPLLCVLFLKIKQGKHEDTESEKQGSAQSDKQQKAERAYGRFLSTILHYRYPSMAAVLVVFSVAIYSFRFIPVIFFPPSEDPTFKLEIELPVGSPISKTQAITQEIDSYLETLKPSADNEEGLTNWAAFIGNGGPRYVLSHTTKPASPNYAVFILNTTSGEVVDKMMAKIDQHVFAHFPDVVHSTRKIENGAAIKNPIEVRIMGESVEQLYALSDSVKQKLASINGVRAINDDWGNKTKNLFVNIDEAQAQRLGINNADIAQVIQASTTGIQISEYRENEDIIPIMLKASSQQYNGNDLPTSMNVLTHDLNSVPLGQVAQANLEWQPALIPRRDRMKTITVSASLAPDLTAAEVNQALRPWLAQAQQQWPNGYRWELGGVAESSGTANKSIFEKLPVAGVIILVLLMAQFNCIRKTTIILMTIPLGLIGVAFGLHVAQSYIGFMTLLGIISLAGIVINNAIVLIDRIDIEKQLGHSHYDAIVVAAKQRMRPILLTTATTVVGMIPLWLGGGVMWEPMAIAIIFGLLGATVLTLGVVPVLYAILFRVRAES
ncbi:AcrB/AcrD/AcrF family protein [Photobacterium sanctipauli]|uniref:AcrB/AcrD/AcrF family protein n=1 Tax=Photobacterium sanctipauli TaxID=1342794 RepID=A0A2T3NYR7_9GAMM|nr:efflux RND transporter permease subunit [Photobacterium sanctipauli]PSW21417.1 AcrB/AcrD/AcrF family protein [Photobacterium sanctipauli]